MNGMGVKCQANTTKKTPTNTKTIERNTNTYTQRVNERQGVKDTQRTTTTTSE